MNLIKTGCPGLDGILQGGFPNYSVNIIGGQPGTGKTILTQQILFQNASKNQKALYFTTVSEPSIKLLHYQKKFQFFDSEKIKNQEVIFFDIGYIIRDQGLKYGIEVISNAINTHKATLVAIDSFKAIHDLAKSSLDIRQFAYELCVELTAWKCTSFLVGEYTDEECQKEPIFAIADGIVNLYNHPKGMQNVRSINVIKLRGVDYFTGFHPFTISNKGIRVFPRIKTPKSPSFYPIGKEKVSTGISGLDEMFYGGILKGTSTLVAGGAGTGKTLISLHFILNGIAKGESGVYVTFQETPSQLYALGETFGWDLERLEKEKKLKILYTSPVELSVDEHARQIQDTIKKIQAERVVIDSLMDIEIATPDKVRFRDFVYSMVNYFKSQGITSILTNEIPELFGTLKLSNHGISFISDNVILLHYTEVDSTIKRAISILKTRGSEHEKEVREFEISSFDGIKILGKFTGVEGLMSGIVHKVK
jgi:circadian clock protein KaiC